MGRNVRDVKTFRTVQKSVKRRTGKSTKNSASVHRLDSYITDSNVDSTVGSHHHLKSERRERVFVDLFQCAESIHGLRLAMTLVVVAPEGETCPLFRFSKFRSNHFHQPVDTPPSIIRTSWKESLSLFQCGGSSHGLCFAIALAVVPLQSKMCPIFRIPPNPLTPLLTLHQLQSESSDGDIFPNLFEVLNPVASGVCLSGG